MQSISILNQKAQKSNWQIDYEFTNQADTFTCTCLVKRDDTVLYSGTSASLVFNTKKEAKENAAKQVLDQINIVQKRINRSIATDLERLGVTIDVNLISLNEQYIRKIDELTKSYNRIKEIIDKN